MSERAREVPGREGQLLFFSSSAGTPYSTALLFLCSFWFLRDTLSIPRRQRTEASKRRERKRECEGERDCKKLKSGFAIWLLSLNCSRSESLFSSGPFSALCPASASSDLLFLALAREKEQRKARACCSSGVLALLLRRESSRGSSPAGPFFSIGPSSPFASLPPPCISA